MREGGRGGGEWRGPRARTHHPLARSLASPLPIPLVDFHLYYTTEAEVEAIGTGTCSNVGFLSVDAWRRALKPMPAQCFPTGAFTNTALAVSGMGTHLVNVLSPEFKMPFHGFGQTFILGAYDGKVMQFWGWGWGCFF